MPELPPGSTSDQGRVSGEAPWAVARREWIPAPRERVWRALTEADEVARWLAPRVEIELDGAAPRYAFFGPTVYGTRDLSDRGIAARPGNFAVLACEPASLIEFRWWIGDVPTVVRFELHGHLEQTDLRVFQRAERPLAWPARRDAPNWWWIYLPALRSTLENERPVLLIDWDEIAASDELAFRVPVATFPWIIWSKLVLPRELERWAGTDAHVDLAAGIYRFRSPNGEPRRLLEHRPEELLSLDWESPDGRITRVDWTIEATDEDTLIGVVDRGPWESATREAKERAGLYRAASLLQLGELSQRGISPREHEWEV